MSDPAFDLLVTALRDDRSASALWVVDENLSLAEINRVDPAAGLQAVTNRVDIGDSLRERGFAVQVSDFDFSAFGVECVDAVYFRVSKEKAIVHHVINSAARCLRAGGTLYLAGAKREGIKTYADKAGACLGGPVSRQRGRNTAMLTGIIRGEEPGDALDDRDYRQTGIVHDGDVALRTKPGLYGWNKIDRGSRLLVECLRDRLSDPQPAPRRVLDLGCGYGYLTVMAHRLWRDADPRMVATDNNIAATDICRQNFARHEIDGDVIPADCGAGIAGDFDWVLCNPPFHQGFATDADLAGRFLSTARRLLASGGRAVFVVNRFIPLEQRASALFSHMETLADDGSFKVLLLA